MTTVPCLLAPVTVTVYIVRKNKERQPRSFVNSPEGRKKTTAFLYELKLSFIFLYRFLVNMFYLDLKV